MDEITVLTPLSALMFVGELSQLTFRCGAASAAFELRVDGRCVFANTYTPAPDGLVTVYDLDRLLDACVETVGALCSISINGTVVSPGGMRVFRCSSHMDVPAAYFVTHFFLSPGTEVRITDPARRELLNVFCTEEEIPTVEATYYLGEGIIRMLNRTFALDPTTGHTCLDVSPRRWRDSNPGRTLVGYTVRCGARRMRYVVNDLDREVSEAFIFLNSFGCWETLYLTGLRETLPEYTRQTALVNGFRRNYDIRETVGYKSLTGPLTHGMEPVAMAMGASPAVFFLESNGDAGAEVIITDCDLKHNNDPTTASDLSFSFSAAAFAYRLTDDRTARMAVPKPTNVSDHTFDDEFE